MKYALSTSETWVNFCQTTEGREFLEQLSDHLPHADSFMKHKDVIPL
jgi:hypothetical protein